jgi:histidinol-phosphate aminotransferase
VPAGGKTLYAWPAFIVYRLATMAHGGQCVEVPLDGGLKHDVEAMAAAVTEDTRIVFVANPNNPTGTWLKGPELEKFMDSLPEGTLFVLDEAYFEYAQGVDGYPDGMDYIREGRQIVVSRTFSKAYGLAGLRIGYGVMPEELAQLMNRVRQPFNVGNIAQAAAMAALDDEGFVTESVALNYREMDRMKPVLEGMGLSVLPSATNFLLIDLAGRSGADVYQGLLERGVIVRPMAPYGLPSTIRVTVGLPEENDIFLSRLKEVV